MLENPSQRIVATTRGNVTITEFRMMSDVWKPGEQEGELVQDASKSKPVAVTIWNERLGASVFGVLKAGMRVRVDGELHMHEWEVSEADKAAGKKDGAELRCAANDVALVLNRVEQVVMRAKREQPAANQG